MSNSNESTQNELNKPLIDPSLAAASNPGSYEELHKKTKGSPHTHINLLIYVFKLFFIFYSTNRGVSNYFRGLQVHVQQNAQHSFSDKPLAHNELGGAVGLQIRGHLPRQ